jgi:hypothetical protein
MIEDFVDNVELLKKYNKKQSQIKYKLINRERLNKISNDLYHSKYKLDPIFKQKVSEQKHRYYMSKEDIKFDNLLNDISNKFNIDNEILINLKNEYKIKKK